MSLLDEAIAEAAGPTSQCHTCAWLDTLTPKKRAEVEEAMADPRPQHNALARTIRRHYPDAPGETSLIRHRKGACCGAR